MGQSKLVYIEGTDLRLRIRNNVMHTVYILQRFSTDSGGFADGTWVFSTEEKALAYKATLDSKKRIFPYRYIVYSEVLDPTN